jgi:magnesium-protoporphyrin IX monomethyl ester (oxidative) cyclase
MRPEFHKALQVDIEWYDRRVFAITTEISRQTFPLELDIDNPAFFAGLRRLNAISRKAAEAKAKGGLAAAWSKIATPLAAGATFLRLYMIPAKRNEMKREIRLAPIW